MDLSVVFPNFKKALHKCAKEHQSQHFRGKKGPKFLPNFDVLLFSLNLSFSLFPSPFFPNSLPISFSVVCAQFVPWKKGNFSQFWWERVAFLEGEKGP
jgi:hypothetical protein